jgi:dihydrofolate synthase/folylpolyglutamate synthase
VDIAVIEVGLGGRLDATNLVDPMVFVISSLSYDHMNALGSTMIQIAGEKAGIIKNGRTVVLAPQKEQEAAQVIKKGSWRTQFSPN